MLKSNTHVGRFFDCFPQVYCLSLPECKERRQYIAGLFAELGVDHYSFFDAFNGDSELVQKAYQDERIKTFPPCFRCGKLECGNSDCNNTLIPAQVATFISYVELFKQFIASDHPFALFVEDDIKLVEAAEKLCSSAFDCSWQDVVKLDSQEPVLLQLGWALCDEHKIVQPVEIKTSLRKMSNPAFALNKAMAKKIVDAYGLVETTVDIFIHRELAKQAKTYTFYPPLFYEMSWSTGEVDSTIHPKQIRVDYLKAADKDSELVALAKNKLANHQKHTQVYPVLALGHPRCGSGYAAKLLTSLGLDVGHEAMHKDGISSWMFTVEDDCPWALNEGAKTRKFKYFKHVIHHVRDPRAAIPSIIRDSINAPASFEFRRKHIEKEFGIDLASFASDFDRAVASYVYWNNLILAQKPALCFRVEDESDKLLEYLLSSGEFAIVEEPEYPPKNVNANKLYKGNAYEKPLVDDAEYAKLPKELLNELNGLCRNFGYDEFKLVEPFDKTTFLEQLETLTLKPTGWLRSAEESLSVDMNGAPLPWWTLPATEFINGVLSKHWRVFEYGCGHSTLWWAKRVSQVIGVDHDKNWFANVEPRIDKPHLVYLSEKCAPASAIAKEQAHSYMRRGIRGEFGYDEAKMTRRGLNDADFIAYADAINQVGGKFDCIVIDGMARRLCADFAVSRLNDGGIIIFDNSNRSDYLEGYQILVEHGFYQLRFSGPVAGAAFPSCTSIFIKNLDSLPKVVFEPSMFGIKEY